MISFKILKEKNISRISELIGEEITDSERIIISEILSSVPLEEADDIEYAVSYFAGCLLLRIFDTGRYLFAFPYEISDEADITRAILSVNEYAMREEIPLVFTDVEAEHLSYLSNFRHMDIDAEDFDATSFRVRIKNECELIDKIPSLEHGRVKLNAICEDDIAEYARLCKDKTVNKYWGYDYSDDVKNPTDEYFYESSLAEFARGVSLCAAIRVDGHFAGEAVIYAFDGRGGAEFAIRLLPEYQGRGLGTESVNAVAALAEQIGLVQLYSRINRKNTASVAMLKKITKRYCDDGETFIFTVYLK